MVSPTIVRRLRPSGVALSVLFYALVWIAPPANAQQVDSTLVARFQLADSYARAGQFDRAIALLENLYETNPETYVFFEKLKESYENVKRYDEAIALVEERIATESDPTVLVAEKARLQYLKGDEEVAFETWDSALEMGTPNANAYRVVYQSLTRVRLFERAVAILESGRTILAQEDLFQMDLAYLYSLTGQHEQAMAEYLGLLEKNDRQLSFVRSRLSRFIEQEGTLPASIAVAEQAVRKTPLNRAFRELLGWLYMEADDYAAALNTYRAIDRLEQENGNVLFTFAQQAADAGAFEVALDAYKEVLDRYAASPTAAEAQFGLAEMHELQADALDEKAFDERGNRIAAPHYENALSAYKTFLQQYPTHPYFPEALRRIGHMQQDVFFRLGEAEEILGEVIDLYANSKAAEEAAYDLGRIALLRGDLDRARIAFGRLVDELRVGELAERSRFELALLHFYKGEFDAALAVAQALNENTSTDVANDAIELKILLQVNRGPDSLNIPLQLYSRASLDQRRRNYSESLSVLDTLLTRFGSHALADDARFLRATILRDTGDYESAVAALLEMPLLHPTSHLADRSLYLAGEIYEHYIGDLKEAEKIYTRLLTEYPGSLFSTEARARIRFLRGDGT